jgi:hypothetical protein
MFFSQEGATHVLDPAVKLFFDLFAFFWLCSFFQRTVQKSKVQYGFTRLDNDPSVFIFRVGPKSKLRSNTAAMNQSFSFNHGIVQWSCLEMVQTSTPPDKVDPQLALSFW